jgi:hypothetical protein
MKTPRERAAEGLKVGDSFSVVRCFSYDDIQQFAQISRDTATLNTRNYAGSRRPSPTAC